MPDEAPLLPPQQIPVLFRTLTRWFGVRERIGPRDYLTCGVLLMLLKYAVEAALIWTFAGRPFYPWDFVNPLMTSRAALVQGAPDWLPWVLLVWTLPFLWVAVSMSVRRAADAGASPWLGMFVLVPLLNIPFMLTLCTPPSQPERWRWSPQSETGNSVMHAKSAALAVGIALLMGGAMLIVSVYLFASYGASLFLGTPLWMSATAAYVDNRQCSRTFRSAMVLGLLTVCFGSLALLLFALEGVICVAMAAPLLLPIGIAGGVLGKAIADATRRPSAGMLAAVMMWPLWAGGESLWCRSPEYLVTSAVEIDASPEVVWPHVISFPDLPAERAWYFRLGISCPERARIVGSGPGAIRYCEFTTGAFVEPITAWEQPHRLAFDVATQPPALFELSPYSDVHPPHLAGYLQSTHGEFRLVPLPGVRTRLEGRTWYRFEMYPQWYWTAWSDSLIHRIHDRVLAHIKRLSEAADSPARRPEKLGRVPTSATRQAPFVHKSSGRS